MSDKVSLNLKVSPLTKAMMTECARLEFRTLSSYVESMVDMDMKAKKLTPEMLQPTKSRTSKVVEEAMPELPGYLDREVWADWVDYKKKSGKAMLVSTIKYCVREMEKAHANGWDVNELLREALAKQWQGFVFEKHRNTRIETSDLLNDEDQSLIRTKKMLEQLMNVSVDISLVSPVLYCNFIGMLHETDQLVDVPQILWLFDQFKMINKGLEWNNSILQRAIEDHHVFNEKGWFDVLRVEERI